MGISLFTTLSTTRRGWTKAVAPRIKPMLARLDPRTFPTAISALPLTVAKTATMNSGAEVPRDTTVSPMTIGLNPKLSWSRAAPRTNQSAPK